MASTLTFIDHFEAAITRKQIRGKWAYFAADGTHITDREEIERLNAVGLPPAYTEAWFAAQPHAHILATGIDARGRKQYRYHPDFRADRDARKFELCSAFGEALPQLRARVSADIEQRSLTRDRAVASVIALLDTGSIRVGNESYARDNSSFGATTLQMRHARIAGGKLRLQFRGKSGKDHDITCNNRALLRFVRRMQDLPGQRLFQYLGADGEGVPVHSDDVNDYLRAAMGSDFSARNFRTWRASATAFGMLHETPGITLRDMLDSVSARLGNTPAIARKSYIHPAVIAAASQPDGMSTSLAKLPRSGKWLDRTERGLLKFLNETVV